MPDITDLDKSKIRLIAKNYIMGLWSVTFTEGFLAYKETFNSLYKRSAKWKFCLKCGKIGLAEELKEGKHQCILKKSVVPVLVTTSWFKLRGFFLTQKYALMLKGIGAKSILDRMYSLAETIRLQTKVEEEENLL